jgi:hypothetical protein
MFKPDLIIGPRDAPQTLRWHIFRFRGWQLALHKWLRSDSDRAPHDHKADNLSIILTGGYWETVREWYEAGVYEDVTSFRWPLVPYFRKAETPHRVTLPSDGKPVWSLWLRWPERRRWGYWCDNKGWVDAVDYLSAPDYYADGISEVGRGCD